ncbi:sugar phosphate isomerase/epimerase [Flagellimonas sp. S3867]|uniref:sugar phosphate isomerase/epimerase family protein n=1 Tax=Flagellimonas sp. S3867 TaxID=2768063 RepID=UPI00168368EC|nr:sugar phosphate isomerase/epimerase [Flagellimonas sp. S3867]
MELKFIYPRWGSADIPWPQFLQKVKENGYDGVEIDLPLSTKKQEILAILKDFELDFVGQHWETTEVNFEKHKEQYKKHLYNLVEGKPLLINSHTGKDFFTFEQNAELLEMAFTIEKEADIVITHETHRSRFSFAAHVCHTFLKEFSWLKLTSDLSHWCCVAETLLENQQDAVNLAIKHTHHVHARVGSSQSAQVIDPRSDGYATELGQFKKWWKQMLSNAEQEGRDYITITPEYGPEPYALKHPKTEQLLADQWGVNQFIKKKIIEGWT